MMHLSTYFEAEIYKSLSEKNITRKKYLYQNDISAEKCVRIKLQLIFNCRDRSNLCKNITKCKVDLKIF